MLKGFGKRKDDIFNGKLFENKRALRNIINKKFSKNIILADDVYMDIHAGSETYKKSNFLYGDLNDIRECFIESNILQMNMSYVVKDYDSILYNTYKETFENAGYNIKVINFIDYLDSDRYNIFSFFNYEEDVTMFVNLVTKYYETDYSKTERLIKDAERYLLEAILYYIMIELPYEEHNMKTVFKILKLARLYDEIDKEYVSDMDLLFKDLENEEEHRALYNYNKFKMCAAPIEKMIVENIEKYLSLYNVNSIRTICNEDELNLEDMIDKYEILFVVTPSYASEYEKLADIFINQVTMYFEYLAEKKYHGELPAPIHIMAPNVINQIMERAIDNCNKRNIVITLGTDSLEKHRSMYIDVLELIEKCSVFICYDYNNLEIKEYVKKSVIKKYNLDIHTQTKVDENIDIELEDYILNDEETCIVFIQYVKAICADVFEASRLNSFNEVTLKEMNEHMKTVEQVLASQIYGNLLESINRNISAIKVGENVNIDIGAKNLVSDNVYNNITMTVKKSY